jgi:hypothetical protein
MAFVPYLSTIDPMKRVLVPVTTNPVAKRAAMTGSDRRWLFLKPLYRYDA